MRCTFLVFCLSLILPLPSSVAAAQPQAFVHEILPNGTRITCSAVEQGWDGLPAEPVRNDYIWRSTHEYIIGSSVGISHWAGRQDVMVGHENWPPTPVEMFAAAGDGIPYWEDSGMYAQVAARAGAYALADFTEGSGIVLTGWYGDLSAPAWTYDLPACEPATFGNTLEVNMDGTRVFYGCFSGGHVRLIVIEAATGSVLVDTPIPLEAASLRNMSVTDSGQYVDLNCGVYHVVYDVDADAERARVHVGASTNPCGISETGEWIVSGFNTTKAYQWDPGTETYVLRWNRATSGHYVGASMISEEGYWIAAWYSSSYNKNRYQLWSLVDGSLTWTLDMPYGTAGVQDLPVAIDYTRERDRIAIGTWGDTQANSPEIIVLDTEGAVIYGCHAAGSIFDVAISENGQYVAGTGKLVHANAWGSGSDTYCGLASEYAAVDPIGIDSAAGWIPEPRLLASPNPFRGATSLQLMLPDGIAPESNLLRIVDCHGRLVQTLDGAWAGDRLVADWNGRSAAGQPLPAGLYYATWSATPSRTTRIVRLR